MTLRRAATTSSPFRKTTTLIPQIWNSRKIKCLIRVHRRSTRRTLLRWSMLIKMIVKRVPKHPDNQRRHSFPKPLLKFTAISTNLPRAHQFSKLSWLPTFPRSRQRRIFSRQQVLAENTKSNNKLLHLLLRKLLGLPRNRTCSTKFSSHFRKSSPRDKLPPSKHRDRKKIW